MCAFGEYSNFSSVWESHVNIDNPSDDGTQKHNQNDDEQTKHASKEIKSLLFDIELQYSWHMGLANL